LNKSLEQLEGEVWGEPDYDSYVVTTVHALRKKPLLLLSDEELRLSLSQKVGAPWILELAVRRLEEDPLRSGDFNPGDVLACALRLPEAAWSSQPMLRARPSAVVAVARRKVAGLEETDRSQITEALRHYEG
jgi:hypothetical protein